MKKIISVILSIMILCSLLTTSVTSTNAVSDKAVKSGNYYYHVRKDGTASIEEYIGKKKKAVIPSTIDGYTVTVIDGFYSKTVESIVIPDTVTTLGMFAFAGCKKLENIEIPDSVTSMDWDTFQYCTSLEEITIPGSIKKIPDDCFTGCSNLKTLIMEEGVQKIGEWAFYECAKLENITFPDSLNKISGGVFDETLWYKNQPKGLVYAGNNIYGCKGKVPEEIVIPEGIKGISGDLFYNSKTLRKITFPKSLTNIGAGAFGWCSKLEEVVLSDGVISIGEQAFYGCSKLKKVTLGENLKSIGFEAFYCCDSLEEINIPDKVETLKYQAFGYCMSLKIVNMGKGVSNVNRNPFRGCPMLTEINVDPENRHFTSVDGILFNKDKTKIISYPINGATEYTIPGTVTTIGNSSFADCYKLKKITFPNSVTEIQADAFQWAGLKHLVLPNSLKTIGMSAFYGNELLKTLTIPKNVKKIQPYSFSDCKNLKKVYYNAKNCTLVPYYTGESDDGSFIFLSCDSLKTIVIGDTVKKIPGDLFHDGLDCNLKKVVIPKKIKNIKFTAFAYHSVRPEYLYAYAGSDWEAIKSQDEDIISITKKGNLKLNHTGTAKVKFRIKYEKLNKNLKFIVT